MATLTVYDNQTQADTLSTSGSQADGVGNVWTDVRDAVNGITVSLTSNDTQGFHTVRQGGTGHPLCPPPTTTHFWAKRLAYSQYDTSALSALARISATTFSAIWRMTSWGAGVSHLYLKDWGAAVDTGDWVGQPVSALMYSFATSGAVNGTRSDFVTNSANANIVTTGYTRVVWFMADASGNENSDPDTGAGTSTTEAAWQIGATPNGSRIIITYTLDVAPNAPTINAPVDSATYDASITLSGTSTDPEADNYFCTFEYQDSGGAWNVIGNGATVASAAASTLVWNTAGLKPSGVYKVRAKSTDTPYGAASAYTTEAGTFTVSHPIHISD